MLHTIEQSQLIHDLTEKSIELLSNIKKSPAEISNLFQQYTTFLEDFSQVLLIISQQPESLWKMQTAYWTEALSLIQEQGASWLEGKPMSIDDKRFESNYWINNPFFNLLSQQYLLVTKHMDSLLEDVAAKDKKLTKHLQFFIRGFMDALSPSNSILTNPELMAETVKTRGTNVLKGLNNLLNDLDSKTSQLNITMTDKKAFVVGKSLAATPGKVIFRNEMMELIQYTPQTSKVYSVPFLMIPPWINKYYILDLSENNSLVRWLVSQGITVFIISWVNPDASYAERSLYDYMRDGPLTAIDIIKKQLNVKKVNTLGFCIGGTLQGLMLAYNKGQKDESIKSATFLATLLDFSDPGDISVYINEQKIQELEKQMKTHGYLAGKFMASSFNSLRANDLIWSFFIKNYLQGKNAAPFDILFWNADTTNMPSKMHSQYLRWMYLHNDLVQPGKLKLHGTPIDISKINIPTFFVSTKKDHIAPWKSTWIGFDLMKGKKEFVLGGSGHIAGIITPPGTAKYGYFTNDKYTKNQDDWLATAQHFEGSWWTYWGKWLKAQSGKQIPAVDIKKLPYSGIMDAPGSYVMVMASEGE